MMPPRAPFKAVLMVEVSPGKVVALAGTVQKFNHVTQYSYGRPVLSETEIGWHGVPERMDGMPAWEDVPAPPEELHNRREIEG